MNNTVHNSSGLISSLALSEVFGSLGIEALTAIAEASEIYSYRKNEVITQIGQKLNGVYIVKSGQVIIHHEEILRHQYVSTIAMAGSCYGFTCLIPNESAIASSKALIPTKIIYISKKKLQPLFKQFPEIAICISGTIYGYLKYVIKLLTLMQTPSVKGRLATWLLSQPVVQMKNANPSERAISIPISKSHLGRTLSVRSETLSRTLAEMRDAGAIKIDDKIIFILRTDILQNYITYGSSNKDPRGKSRGI